MFDIHLETVLLIYYY